MTETRPDGTQLHCVLDDKVDRRLALQFPNLSPNPGDISYSFDNNDNIVGITRNGLTTSISYDALNRRSLQTLPSGVTTNWYYDSHGFVSLILSNNGNLDGHSYTRDMVGNITQEAVNGQTFTYGYDDLSRLSSASVLGVNYSWTYDLAGNRLTQVAGGVTTTYTYNAADRLATVNGTAVSHDANGEVTADETGGAYTWDVRGRLVGLTRNGVTASFVYDQDDLRLAKTVGGVTTSYLLDGSRVLRETTGGVATDLLQGPGTDNLLSRGGNWLLHNGLDSTAAVVNGSGSILQYYYYAPFGQLSMQGGGAPQPYQFTGREADETGLMYYRARYYNPGWGRFASEDPIGFAGGMNPFVYADNNPIRNTDPTGHTSTLGDSNRDSWTNYENFRPDGYPRTLKGLRIRLSGWADYVVDSIRGAGKDVVDTVIMMLLPPDRPRRVKQPHMIDPRDLPLPPGISGTAAFGDFVGWGTKAEGAIARTKNITLREIETMGEHGLTPDVAKTWRDYYHQEWVNKGNDVFQARETLMDLIYRALIAG